MLSRNLDKLQIRRLTYRMLIAVILLVAILSKRGLTVQPDDEDNDESKSNDAVTSEKFARAIEICTRLMTNSATMNSNQLLAGLVDLRLQLSDIYPGDDDSDDYRFPEKVEGATRDLVRNMLNLFRLTQTEPENCMLPGSERQRKHRYNYHELHQILIQELGSTNANLAQFINHQYNWQLQSCRQRLLSQFGVRVQQFLRLPTQDTVRKLIDNLKASFPLDEFADIRSIEGIDREQLISGVVMYHTISSTRDNLADTATRLNDLQKTIQLRFTHLCGAFLLDPFKTLMGTYELVSRQEQALIEKPFADWVRSYKICSAAHTKLTNDDWKTITKELSTWLGDILTGSIDSTSATANRVNLRSKRTNKKRNTQKGVAAGIYINESAPCTTSQQHDQDESGEPTMHQLITQDYNYVQEQATLERIRANIDQTLANVSKNDTPAKTDDQPHR